jgi:hypothetical protein
MRSSNSAGVMAAKSRSKRSTIAVSRPVRASSSSFSCRLEMRAGASPGTKNSRGRGSKVSAADARPRRRASATTLASIAWWPRCTPSKLPMASAALPGIAAWRAILIAYSWREKSRSRKPMSRSDAK